MNYRARVRDSKVFVDKTGDNTFIIHDHPDCGNCGQQAYTVGVAKHWKDSLALICDQCGVEYPLTEN